MEFSLTDRRAVIAHWHDQSVGLVRDPSLLLLVERYGERMCGRVVTASGPEELSEHLGADAVVDVLEGPDYNVAPLGRLPIAWEAAEGGRRLLGTARWGLVPRWAKEASFGERTFNARMETVATKPSYRSAFRRRRCLVPVDGYYEWSPGMRPVKGVKQPWYVSRTDGNLMVLAGLWEDWIDPEDAREEAALLRTCTVITVEASAEMAAVHHRMPAVLESHDWGRWLDSDMGESLPLQSLLSPAPVGVLCWHPVDHRVGDARCNGEQLTKPIELDVGTSPDDGSDSDWVQRSLW